MDSMSIWPSHEHFNDYIFSSSSVLNILTQYPNKKLTIFHFRQIFFTVNHFFVTSEIHYFVPAVNRDDSIAMLNSFKFHFLMKQ